MAPDLSGLHPGSLADVPKDLLTQIKELERLFTVDQTKLKQITDHFVGELERGLSRDGSTIPMNPTWVMAFPTGYESGTYLALDMGGTNLRVCEVHLPEEKGEFDITQSKYRMPEELKTGDVDELWEYVADCVQEFVEYHHADENLSQMHLGFTFSYPATQDYVDHGVLQRWTKGFDIAGVEGNDVVPMFEAALAKRVKIRRSVLGDILADPDMLQGLPIKVTALINDTTGTLIASAYTDPDTKIGCIFGTGCNAAYMENCGSIPKLAHMKLDPDLPMAINCEYGAFDSEHHVLPRTPYDIIIDRDSPRPDQQSFEKMVSGLYLGEIFRLVLVALHENPHVTIFQGQHMDKLKKPYSLDTSFLSQIEEDPFENLTETAELLHHTLDLRATKPELELCRRLAELIGTRAARLSACGVAAICKKKGMKSCHVGADGSVFEKYPHFRQRGAQALREILDWTTEEDPVVLHASEDGSGVGAAIIAALTLQRVKEGNVVGVRNPSGMD